MDITVIAASFVVGAYLLGSISSAIIVCTLLGLEDPRKSGSNNPGATNVLRIGGKKAAAITLVGDMLKGALPLFAARIVGVPVEVLAFVGLAAFLGHLYPVFFRFQGGKGVATALGVLLGWYWLYFLITAGIWLVVSKVFKISSLAALIAFFLTPIYMYVMGVSTLYLGVICIITMLIFFRHKSNIQRILSGEESFIGKSR